MGIVFSFPFGEMLLSKSIVNLVVNDAGQNVILHILCALLIVLPLYALHTLTGDTLTYQYPDRTEKFIITGIYQSLMNMGKGGRVSRCANMEESYMAGLYCIQVEIEDFVKEIVSASSEEIISIEVKDGEFYLKELVDKVKEAYVPKAQISLLDLQVGTYENKLLKGEINREIKMYVMYTYTR